MRALHHREDLHVAQGEEVVLSCVVTGRPAPLITWYVNSTHQLGLWDAVAGRGVIHKSRRNSRLHLSNMQPTDSGNYSCLAENVNGYIKKTVQIRVHPCYRYCLHGYCNLVDGRPSCRCKRGYLGRRCEVTTAAAAACILKNKADSHERACFQGDSRVLLLSYKCCDQFYGRLVLFSTLGGLLSLLLLLLIVCLCVKKKSIPLRFSTLQAPSATPIQLPNLPEHPGNFPRALATPQLPNPYTEAPTLVPSPITGFHVVSRPFLTTSSPRAA
ncbi:unnamed protein product, partial [Mesocestoides corti]